MQAGVENHKILLHKNSSIQSKRPEKGDLYQHLQLLLVIRSIFRVFVNHKIIYVYLVSGEDTNKIYNFKAKIVNDKIVKEKTIKEDLAWADQTRL